MNLAGVDGDEEAETMLEGDMGGEKADGRGVARAASGGDDMIVSVCVTVIDMMVMSLAPSQSRSRLVTAIDKQ